MNLLPNEAKLYFELMWTLQYHFKKEHKLLPDIKTLADYSACAMEQKLEIRNKLFDNAAYIDKFINRNPAGFSDAHLDVVAGWKHYRSGEFYLERYLKKYAIFISDKQGVYAVNALHDAFEDLYPKSYLPLLVRTLLLPFKGRIIYDGMMEAYRITFGGGMKRRLKERYMAEKQNGRLIFNLPPSDTPAQVTPAPKAVKNWKREIETLQAGAKKLKGGAGQPAIVSPAFSLIKTSLELGQLAATDPENTRELWKVLKKMHRAFGKVRTTLERTDY